MCCVARLALLHPCLLPQADHGLSSGWSNGDKRCVEQSRHSLSLKPSAAEFPLDQSTQTCTKGGGAMLTVVDNKVLCLFVMQNECSKSCSNLYACPSALHHHPPCPMNNGPTFFSNYCRNLRKISDWTSLLFQMVPESL